MSPYLIILMIPLAVSVLIITAYMIHWTRIRRSDVRTPNLEQLEDLEKAVHKMQETGTHLIRTDGHLEGRSRAFRAAVEEIGTESENLPHNYTKKTFIKIRERSEEAHEAILENKKFQ